MKVAGIVLIAWGCLMFGSIINLSNHPEYAEQLVRSMVLGIGLIGLGIYLLNRAKEKKKEQEEKEKWNKGSDIE